MVRHEESEQTRRAKEFLREVRRELGVSEEEMQQIPELLRWGIKYKRRMDALGELLGKSVVATLVVGLLYAVWEGVKHFGNSR